MSKVSIPIDYWSYSSMTSFLNNTLSFRRKYILKIKDDPSSPSGVVGKACHKAVEFYYNGMQPESAIEMGLKEIDNTPDSFIDYGKTGTRQNMLDSYGRGMKFFFEEEPKFHKILDIEVGNTFIGKNIFTGEELPVPMNAYLDLVAENELGELEIIDWKFTSKFQEEGDIVGFKKFIQSMFYYHYCVSKYSRQPARMRYIQCKTSKNKDGLPQIREYIFDYNDSNRVRHFAGFYNLYGAVTHNLGLPLKFLPNPNDMFDGQYSFELFIKGQDDIDAPIAVREKIEHVQYVDKKYVPSMLDKAENSNLSPEEKIRQKLIEHQISVQMDKTYVGPSITKYTLRPPRGVAIRKIAQFRDDLAMALEAHSLRIEAPIRGTSLVGIEVPSKERKTIDLVDNHLHSGTMDIPIGVDVFGDVTYKSLSDMPHLLIAGQTGAGKSVMLNVILKALTSQLNENQLKLILIDPKRVELSQFAKLPHLAKPVVYDIMQAVEMLDWVVKEMESRYKELETQGVRSIDDYKGNMPKVVVVIDEFADLIMSDIKPSAETMDVKRFNQNLLWLLEESPTGKLTQRVTREALKRTIEDTSPPSAQDSIIRIAQKARAVGIHLVLATQRPSADVITGLIKANIPTKIAFSTTNSINSKIILDETGAEQLTGKGDMLFMTPGQSGVKRLQGLYC